MGGGGGGEISDNFAHWRRLTSDKWILLQVQGVQVEFQEILVISHTNARLCLIARMMN